MPCVVQAERDNCIDSTIVFYNQKYLKIQMLIFYEENDYFLLSSFEKEKYATLFKPKCFFSYLVNNFLRKLIKFLQLICLKCTDYVFFILD